LELAYICIENTIYMKLLFAILLMSTVISSELANIIEVSGNDICLMDTTSEGESEKEASETIEDVPKVKIKQDVNFMFLSNNKGNQDLSLNRLISTPYLEIHSPPPEQL